MNSVDRPSLLITGHLGFVGQALLRDFPQLVGGDAYDYKTLSADLDILDIDSLQQELAVIQPDAVLHLAAQSFVPESFKNPSKTLAVNLMGTLHLLQALDRVHFKGRLLYVSSADVYGLVPEHCLPIAEDQPAAPRNPYAVSKLAAEYLCQQWAFQAGYSILIARPFNHIGPGQDERFIWADITRQIAAIELGQQSAILTVGNLEVSRDFTAVDDVLQAYIDLLKIPASALSGSLIYNICSGQESYLNDLLDRLINERGIQIDIQVDPNRLRAVEQVRTVGSSKKIKEQVSWMPKKPLMTVLHNMVEDWKRKLQA
jgi:GDP-4-dehydro-6-deoxy-D-mannose reductase